MTRKIFFLAISLFIINSLNSQITNLLANKFWKLNHAQIQGKDYYFNKGTSEAPTLQFSGDNVRGNGGCNAYHSKYTINGKSLAIANIMSTKMACNDLEFNESQYFSALSQGHTIDYEENSNTLTLTNQSGDILTYSSLFTKQIPTSTYAAARQRVYDNEEDNVAQSTHHKYKKGRKHRKNNEEVDPKSKRGKKLKRGKKGKYADEEMDDMPKGKKGKHSKRNEVEPKVSKKGRKGKHANDTIEESPKSKKGKHSKSNEKDTKDSQKGRKGKHSKEEDVPKSKKGTHAKEKDKPTKGGNSKHEKETSSKDVKGKKSKHK